MNAEETELTKYFRKINVFKKSRSAGLLPNVLARSISLKEKEYDSPTNVSHQSPVKKNVAKNPNENFDENEKRCKDFDNDYVRSIGNRFLVIFARNSISKSRFLAKVFCGHFDQFKG